ncbi:hypothetical protein BKA67DRAFT_549803 [Truncatella angustata]|uniref:Mucoidy inhibitor-like protein n=1 Tax=Truncatella angustata TaxID=152316 RepID=A0A9P9A561_9PEZI|nr:uncharacterized protein BKA67DRAFT_549803 [Truncatella angustata]KAH6660980.1 hypothetical protein BKA67DRAFT_549803 [Truncatella angustata]KAH8203694.1 hypothetical protein TruAng_002107 [Truncatella angustata]
MNRVHQHDFQIRDLATQSVTLFPGRAQVVREIKAQLKPGANQITIIGLTPGTDEHSIKVEGTGSAIITDINIQSLPNREVFEDVYPDSDESESGSESDHDNDDEVTDSEYGDVKDISEKIATLLDEQRRANELVASAESRMKILDSYGIMLASVPPNNNTASKVQDFDIITGLDTYRTEREKIHQDYMEGNAKQRELNERMEKLQTDRSRLQKRANKRMAKADKEKAKALRHRKLKEQKAAHKRERLVKEKLRIRREREAFWPRNVYIVKVSLEAVDFTPVTSRRGSVSSDSATLAINHPETVAEGDIATTKCDLTLSYVTSYAYWSPSYDLALSTTTNSGTLCFDAQLTNMTSETWSKCKIMLSTSQADFSRLNDELPTLVPWYVRLAEKRGFGFTTHVPTEIMYSREEESYKTGTGLRNARNTEKPRAELFGIDNVDNRFGVQPLPLPHQIYSTINQITTANSQNTATTGGGLFGRVQDTNPAPTHGGLFGSSQAVATVSPQSGGLFGRVQNTNPAATHGGLFGSSQSVATVSPQSGGLFGALKSNEGESKKKDQLTVDKLAMSSSSFDGLLHAHGEIGAVVMEAKPDLEFQGSVFEEVGFTSTYEIDGSKTLSPASNPSKQRVARVSMTSVTFSHNVVAKYKPAAYLKAKLRNESNLTLLKGPTGLTLDGTFIGRTTLPRCSPSETFDLNLGIDPAIRVAYPKPDVKRSQTGFISKEDSSTFKRLITLSNTRSDEQSKPAQITVLDQIPVSEDERLRIEIIQPKGLVAGSYGVSTGAPENEGKEHAIWGEAVSTLKNGGEISWDVKLNAGRSVKLAFEYDLSIPAGERAVNI